MPKGVRQAIATIAVALIFFGILYVSYRFLPRRPHLGLLDIGTGLAVLVVAELAVLHSGKSRFRFRLAAQLPLLVHFGVFPVLIGQSGVVIAQEIRESWVTKTFSPHYPRILSAILVPTVSGLVYQAVVSSGSSVATESVALVAAAMIFWLASALLHFLPGRRTLMHPWTPPFRGWFGLLLVLDATMAFVALVQYTFGEYGSEIAVTLELVALMGSLALYTDANIRKSQLVKLTTLVSDLSSDSDWETLGKHLFEGISGLVKVHAAALWFVREDGRLYPYLVHSYGSRYARLEQAIKTQQVEGIPIGIGLVGFAASSQDVIRVRSSSQELLFQWEGMRKVASSALATPIRIQGEVMAVLSIYHSSALSAYTHREKELFRVLSKQLSSIFTMLWRYEQTKLKAELDELTGLYNYRHFDEALHKCVSDSDVSHEPLTLLLIDLDHFKQINDRFGHLAGNQVLISLAKTLKEMVRTDDIVARYGGEEFTILLPGLSSNEGQVIAERIRSRVENMSFDIESGFVDPGRPASTQTGSKRSTVKLTLSIGVATYPDKADSPLTLIRHADRAMYVGSKQSGRNKVSTYV